MELEIKNQIIISCDHPVAFESEPVFLLRYICAQLFQKVLGRFDASWNHRC